MRLLPLILLLLSLIACGGTPRDPGTIAQANEVRLLLLEKKVLDLERENTDILMMVDQMDDQHMRCVACQSSCDDAAAVVRNIQKTIEQMAALDD
jgi:hypothetical protein